MRSLSALLHVRVDSSSGAARSVAIGQFLALAVAFAHFPLALVPGEIGGVQVREISNGGYGDRGGVKVGELLIAVNTDVVDKEPYDNIISKINSYKVGRNSNGEVMMLRFKRK